MNVIRDGLDEIQQLIQLISPFSLDCGRFLIAIASWMGVHLLHPRHRWLNSHWIHGWLIDWRKSTCRGRDMTSMKEEALASPESKRLEFW